MEIQKVIIVITGGASGMGAACAAHFAKLGMRVVVWDRTPVYVTHIELAVPCDVSNAQSVEHALMLTKQQVGIPRILINCAGIAPAKRMVGKNGPQPLQDFQQVIDINLVGTFNVMRLVVAAMLEYKLTAEDTERGVIINTASIAAFEGQIGQMAYSASKGGIVSMTLPAARELAQHAIRVNTIAPGLIATPMLLGMPDDVQIQLSKSVTFPQRFGKPEEFAQLAQQLIENEFMNGEVIRFDGALRMQAK